MKLTGTTRVAPDLLGVYEGLASELMGAAIDAVERRGEFHLALSGGSTPENLYMHLVIDPRYRAIPWRQSHVWLVDERRVALDDAKSNFRMIRESLLDHVPIRQRAIHAMPALDPDPAAAYEAQLRQAFSHQAEGAASPPRLDFVLLGMGDDAHTASLFPHSPALAERERWIAVNAGPSVTPPARVTMTFPLLNAARQVAVLVTGARKHATLARLAAMLRTAGPDPLAAPVTGVAPDEGGPTWHLDREAATGQSPAPAPPKSAVPPVRPEPAEGEGYDVEFVE